MGEGHGSGRGPEGAGGLPVARREPWERACHLVVRLAVGRPWPWVGVGRAMESRGGVGCARVSMSRAQGVREGGGLWAEEARRNGGAPQRRSGAGRAPNQGVS